VGPDTLAPTPPETFALKGRSGVVALDERGVHHPRTPRGGAFVHTPYDEIIHLACSSRAMWLGARRSVYVLPRRMFVDPGAPERLVRSVLERVAAIPGGEGQLARMARIEEISREFVPTRATWGLALLCLAIFPLQLFLGQDVESVGYFYEPLVRDGDWWRMLTANLLHAAPKFPMHLVMNLLGLVALGTLAERPLGTMRTLLVMGLSGLGAMAASGLAGHARVVGVSGVVFGLLGAVTWIELRLADRLPAWWRVPRRALFIMILFSAALPLFVPIIAGAAHLGGFLAGAAVTALVFRAPERRAPPRWVRAAGTAVVAATLLAMVAAGLELARPGNYTASLYSRMARLPEISAGELNEYAWVVAVDPDSSPELLEGALAMAERAVIETERGVPELLDTLAEVQFQLGQKEAAVETIQEAIAQKPFEPYYREQLRRFLGERDPDDRPAPPGFAPGPRPAPQDPGVTV
jgi:rhomboid protease GluP